MAVKSFIIKFQTQVREVTIIIRVTRFTSFHLMFPFRKFPATGLRCFFMAFRDREARPSTARQGHLKMEGTHLETHMGTRLLPVMVFLIRLANMSPLHLFFVFFELQQEETTENDQR